MGMNISVYFYRFTQTMKKAWIYKTKTEDIMLIYYLCPTFAS